MRDETAGRDVKGKPGMLERPVAASVVIVVESGGRYLMTEEERGGKSGPVWYFPSGALEPHETLADAGRREVREETGYDVEPTAVVAIDHGAFTEPSGLLWWRIVVAARLKTGNRQAVNEPDILCVEWVNVDQLDRLALRSGDARWLCERARSGPGLPLDACRLSLNGRLEGFFA